jgi:hypothetical protein
MKRLTLAALLGLPAAALAQTAPIVLGFCPPEGARVDPRVVLLDDLCNAHSTNSYRLQEQAAPLSFGQKAGYFRQNKLFSASSLFGAAFFGEIANIRQSPPEWKKGWTGLGRRAGTRYAQSLSKSTAEFVFGLLEDPRPNPPPQPMVRRNGVWQPNPRIHDHRASAKFGPRLGRALLTVVWTHYDSGSDGIAFSRIGGAVASGVTGIGWTPASTNTWGQVGIRTGTAFGGYAAGAIFHEFQPDVTKLLARLTGQSRTPSVNGGKP